MTATNHALTGALIGFSISDPWIALPLAFISHFILDVIPHYGSNQNSNSWIKSTKFKTILAIDICFCLALGVLLLILQPKGFILALFCAIIATSPDLIHIRKFVLLNRNRPIKLNVIERFSAVIQWFERPSGAYVEVFYGLVVIVLLKFYF